MTRTTARAIWGDEVVDRALAEEHVDDATADLAREISERADPPGAFRAWALAQPWPRFCAIVRIVAGETRREILKGKR